MTYFTAKFATPLLPGRSCSFAEVTLTPSRTSSPVLFLTLQNSPVQRRSAVKRHAHAGVIAVATAGIRTEGYIETILVTVWKADLRYVL